MGAPDGAVFNSAASGFVISKGGASAPSRSLFVTEDGTIVDWNPTVDPTHAVIAVDRSTATDQAGDKGAVLGAGCTQRHCTCPARSRL